MKFRTILTVVAIFAIVQCDGRRERVTRPAQERATPKRQVVRVGYIPVTHCIPLYIADMQGRFRAAGLEVQLVPQQGGPKVLEALAAKSIDIGFSNVVSLLVAREQGMPFLPITGGPVESGTHKDHAVLVKSTSAVREPSQLKGKRLAINSRRNIDHLMIELWLRKYGLKETDVELRELPFPQMEAALVAGQVDAIATAEPFITVTLKHGAGKVLSWNYVDVRSRTFVSTYVTTEAYHRDHADVVAAFARVIGEASEVANGSAVHSRAALAKYTKIAPEFISNVSLPFFEATLDQANVEETMQLAIDVGLLARPVNLRGWSR